MTPNRASTPRTIQLIPLTQLRDHPANPKQHSVNLIAASHARLGTIDLITRDDRTGYTISGHGRTKALRAMYEAGDPPPDGITISDTGEWLVPVVTGWASTDDDHARAALVTLNTLTEAGGWDDSGLLATLQALAESDMELLALTGRGLDDIAALEALLAPDPEPRHTDPDAVPEPPTQPVTQSGDVWTLGPHRVMCGDSRSPDDITTLLDAATVNMAFTSPPYASQRTYDTESEFQPIPPDQYVEWFAAVAANIAGVLATDGSWFVNIKAHADDGQRSLYVHDLTTTHVRSWGWRFVDEFCWFKPDPFPGHWPGRFKNGFEPVMHFSRGDHKHRPKNVLVWSETAISGAATHKRSPQTFSNEVLEAPKGLGLVRPSNVLPIAAGGNGRGGHAAAFPVALPTWFIRAFTDPGDVVYDPFMGSGSTLIATHDEQRIGYGMEISPRYVDVICRRFQEHTGIMPTRDGVPHDFTQEQTA